MVNKTAVGVLAVVVLASLGVGILIGMQMGGGEETVTNASPTTDGTTDASTDTRTDPATSAETETPVDQGTEQPTTIAARQFDEDEIATHVATFVNRERVDQGRVELTTDDETGREVAVMARNHSVGMANAGTVGHDVNGVSTASRYKNYDLFERCKFKSNEGSYIRQPDEKFELLGLTYAGKEYQDDGQEQFNGDERAVARVIVDNWNESATYRERLLVDEPRHMGVGVEVTEAGKAYVTLDVCA